MPTRKSKGQRATLLALALLIPPFFPACPKNEPPTRPQARVSTSRTSERLPPIPATFNGERAMDHVKKQMEFGPRPPGTSALEKTRNYIVNQLKSYDLNVSFDPFTAKTPQGDKKMVNIVAEVPGETKDLILITSHYDTKYFKDMTFLGANDPGASVATLLEIGRVLGSMKEKPKLTYRLVFFDGEEAFCENWDDCSKPDEPDNTYGSRHYVTTLKAKNELSNTKAMILLDMMGYKDLNLGRDTMSTRWLQDIVWETGYALDHGDIFVERDEGVGGDDHEAFIKAGIPAVDIIQLNSYPYWHKANDTIDKISAQSMKIVGDVVLASLPKIAAKVASQESKGVN
jgi:Zn-dependent M28 family amino/carboxypeptidase